ncbi:hypothetical protein GC088_12600 [Arthrobacter sp. JZ12]|uniref:hypothetical protein n=1 Tax=Arthrobacter sp. JZ12 TaxID=2654190 RepID=UPI002B4810EB|nr:hypothetical protein [Arthrobacter sp. JZ12]WRH25826.1 hypothetical protein GC088_12600 [Arthrobacter sp. JZ12]
MRASETVHAENQDFLDSPFYRVNFWEQASPPRGWMLDAYVLSDVEDLTEVQRWIEGNARGRRFELFVEMQQEPVKPFASPRKSGLIRLLRSDPNAGEPVHITASLPT